jgi:hypothetical protein
LFFCNLIVTQWYDFVNGFGQFFMVGEWVRFFGKLRNDKVGAFGNDPYRVILSEVEGRTPHFPNSAVRCLGGVR